jgi:hypothetical protein
VTIGHPLPRAEIDRFRGDPKGLMDHLRASTYRLAPRPLHDIGYGYDFG